MGLLLISTGCGFFRDRLCCNRPGTLMSRFRAPGASAPMETAGADCGCEGTLTSGGPMLGMPIIPATGGGAILPNPTPIPQIKENPGLQKEYDPNMKLQRTKPINETKATRD